MVTCGSVIVRVMHMVWGFVGTEAEQTPCRSGWLHVRLGMMAFHLLIISFQLTGFSFSPLV